jgi:hypothetical protein
MAVGAAAVLASPGLTDSTASSTFSADCCSIKHTTWQKGAVNQVSPETVKVRTGTPMAHSRLLVSANANLAGTNAGAEATTEAQWRLLLPLLAHN